MPSVTELALGFLVDLSRGVSRATADYHSGRAPEVIMGRQLAGSCIGIIGYGSIGKYLATVAQSLGMTVLVADPFARVDEPNVRHVPLEDLLAQADYVVCLAVANEGHREPDRRGPTGADAAACILHQSVPRRTGRRGRACIGAREKRIAGAAMDVGRARDQMPSAELASLPNVIATPHIGGLTPPAIESQALETVRQVEAIIGGDAPVGAVNAGHWTLAALNADTTPADLVGRHGKVGV